MLMVMTMVRMTRAVKVVTMMVKKGGEDDGGEDDGEGGGEDDVSKKDGAHLWRGSQHCSSKTTD